MTDRELLELAAKAAGIEIDCWPDEDPRALTSEGLWYPLTDDGDAFRLAMRLGMRVSLREAHADGGAIRICDDSEDWMCATRRAIVRAAAEIGRSIK